MTGSRIIISALAAVSLFLLACGESVITSKAGRLSPGGFTYLRLLYFQEERDPAAVARSIIELDARGILADRLHFRKDPYYESYVFMERRRRHQRAAWEYFLEKLGKEFSPSDMMREFRVKPEVESAAAKILSGKKKDGSELEVSPRRVKIATWPRGDITLDDIRVTMLPDEWTRMLSLARSPLGDALMEHLIRWLYREGNRLFLAETGAEENQLRRFDHNRAAELYLLMKYGFAEEGIYPTKIMEIDLEPKELIGHFLKIRSRLLPLRRALVRYTAVKDFKTADRFMEELAAGKSFRDLADTYAIHSDFRKTGTPRFVKPDDAVKVVDEKSGVPAAVINVARDGRIGTVKIPLRPGIVIIDVIKVERVKRTIRYEDFMEEVKYDLNRDLLRRQFPIDLADTVREMNAVIALKNIQ